MGRFSSNKGLNIGIVDIVYIGEEIRVKICSNCWRLYRNTPTKTPNSAKALWSFQFEKEVKFVEYFYCENINSIYTFVKDRQCLSLL